MKNAIFVLALLLGLAACTPAVIITPTSSVMRLPTDTATPIPSPTVTPMPTDTQLPNETSTPEATATKYIAQLAAVTVESFQNFDYITGFLFVTPEQDVQLIQSINKSEAPDQNIMPVHIINRDGQSVELLGTIGVKTIPTYAISEMTKSGNTGHFMD